MRYYEYGKGHEKTILLLPGTCCNVKCNFSQVIPLLAEHFRVIGVDYDGFDGAGTEFPDMLTVTKKIEGFVRKKLGGNVYAVYGSSLGGSFVGLLVQRRNIHIEHAIIGSSDLDQSSKLSAFLQTELLGGALYKMLRSGAMPKWMLRFSEKKMGKEVTEKYRAMLGGIGEAMTTVSKQSMKRQFYSDLVTPLDLKIRAEGTTVHVFYALKMGEKYLQRYRLHFFKPDIIEQDYGHEELLFFYPEKWTEAVLECCGERNETK